jgi:hypothetical protein
VKRLVLALTMVAALGCGRGQGTTAGSPKGPLADGSASSAATVAPPRTEQDETLWARAKEGEPDELARLAHREGPAGLIERGARPEWRRTAIQALAYSDSSTNLWVALPWLAEVADGPNAEEAQLAVETSAALASRPRRAVDPEDAVELRAGCDRLTAVAKNAQRPKPVRVGAIRTLRMLADFGCPPLDTAAAP